VRKSGETNRQKNSKKIGKSGDRDGEISMYLLLRYLLHRYDTPGRKGLVTRVEPYPIEYRLPKTVLTRIELFYLTAVGILCEGLR
jgi:hypothetical protein